MVRQIPSRPSPAASPRAVRSMRGVAHWLASMVWVAAGAVGAVLAFIFAASFFVLAMISSVLLAIARAGARMRWAAARSAAGVADSDVIEARQVGGHSWVAYGFEGDLGST